MTFKLARVFFLVLFLVACGSVKADDGYKLWQRYEQVQDQAKLQAYRQAINELIVQGNSPTLTVAQQELQTALSGLLGQTVSSSQQVTKQNILVVGTPASSALVKDLGLTDRLSGW